MLFDRKTHLNYDICSQKHLFPIILFRFFLSAMTREQLEVGWIFVSLILSFTILFLLLCYQSSNTTLRLWESTRAVFLFHDVMDIHKFE